MRTHLTLAVAAVLVLSALAVGQPAVATSDEQKYEQGQPAEREPNCRGADDDGDGEADRQATGVVVDPNEVDPADLFGPEDKTAVEVDLTVGDDQFLTYCTGEQWDGQDPNTRESRRNQEAEGDADEPLVDGEDGTVYVNPLWNGDCSGWHSEQSSKDEPRKTYDDGCWGGTQRPTLTEPVHARATADAPASADDDKRASVYVNEELWGLHRCAYAVGIDHQDREGWIFNMCEDHSDQLVHATVGEETTRPIAQAVTGQSGVDGNLQCIPFGIPQGGTCAEGDCTSHEYQDASGNEIHEDHEHDCTRDNTVFFVGVQLGYAWLPLPEASQEDIGTSSSPILP